MNRMRIYAMFAVTAIAVPAAGASNRVHQVGAVDARVTILSLLKERRDAFYAGDIAKFQAFETDDFTRITEGGKLITKSQQLEYMRADEAARETSSSTTFQDQELKVEILGNSALLTGVLSETEQDRSGAHTERSRFTEIWVLRKGRWQTLHNHYTRVAP